MRLPLDGFYVDDSAALMNQELINAYLHQVKNSNGEVIEEGLYGSPGLEVKQITTTGANNESNRGSFNFKSQPYFVNGTKLFRLNADLTTTEIGDLPGAGPVSMAASATQLMILVPGGNGFISDGTIVTRITDTDFKANGNPQVVFFVNAKFVVTTDTEKFIVNEGGDGFTWNALDFGSDEVDPDPLVGGLSYKTQAVLFGGQTTTFYTDVGGSGFPFEQSGLFLDKGLFARFSVVKSSETFFMIGGGENESAAVWMFQGNGYVKTSTGAIDKLLAGLTETELSNITSYAYSDNNNYFVEWSLPNETISYDVELGKWHVKQSRIGDVIKSWRPRNIIKAYNKLFCGDRIDGTIGEVDRDFLDEYGAIIHRTFDVRPIRSNMNTFAMPRIEVTMQSGVGNATVIDPQVQLSISRNGSVFNDHRTR